MLIVVFIFLFDWFLDMMWIMMNVMGDMVVVIVIVKF